MKEAVLVTGASQGTGYAIAARFARAGYAVCVTSRDEAMAEAAAGAIAAEYGVPAHGFALTPVDEAAVVDAFARVRAHGLYVGALVLSAAHLGIGQDSLTIPLDEWRAVLDTNLAWNFALMRQAALQMREQGGGAICVIGSNTARRAIRDRAAYIASKGGLASLVKALAVEWGPLGIRVNTVVAGSIKTARWDSAAEEWRDIRRKRAPIGDIADFEDIADAAYFLCSPQARVITGAELLVDGGVDAQFLPAEYNG